MSDDLKMTEPVVENSEVKQEPQEQIQIDVGTAFALRVQEFDKKIAAAELEVAKLKSEKMDFVYSENVQQVVMAHKEKLVKAQIEEETKKKLSESNK